jgi:hypothetical protein
VAWHPLRTALARSARAALHASEYVAGGLGGWLLPLLLACIGLLPFSGALRRAVMPLRRCPALFWERSIYEAQS